MFRFLFKNVKITTQLIIWFLAISLIPLIVVSYFSNESSQKVLHEETVKYLSAIAEQKGDNIDAYLSEIKRNIRSLLRDPSFADALIEFDEVVKKYGFDSPEYNALEKELRPFLSYYQQLYEYQDTFLISTDGDIIFTVTHEDDFKTNLKTGPYKDSELAGVFNRTQTLLQTDISDFKYYEPSNQLAAFIATPVYKGKNIVGIVAFQISPDEIFRLVQDYSGLGETGEMVLGSKDGDKIGPISPLRFDPGFTPKRKALFGLEQGRPLQEAVHGRNGFGISTDYRNEEILAVWRYLPSLRLGIVVKIDTAEIFAPANKLKNRLFIIIMINILLVVIAAILIAKSIFNPIRKLKKGAEIIGKGNLEYRIEIESQDEIGQLAMAFNQMTEDLKEHGKEMMQKNKELEESQESLEKINTVMTGRELKMIELKKEILKLKYPK